MKTFYPTYLYIKTHNITGLKYFGKTTKDPYRYNGSGKHWLAHLKKHGGNITTEIVGFFASPNDCTEFATHFSVDNKIVESEDWANMIIENGLDGGATIRDYAPVTEETRKKISEGLKGKVPWNKGLKGTYSSPNKGKPLPEETKRKISNSLKNYKPSQESIDKTSNALRGRKRPEAVEWLTGRNVSEETRRRMSVSQKGITLSEETKEKIRKARSKQVITEETKKKLKGLVVVADKNGKCHKICKEDFYSQEETGDNREFVAHNSKEGKRRKKFHISV